MIKPMEMRKMVMKITPKFMDPALDDEGRFVLVEDLSEDLVDFFYMEDPYNTIKVNYISSFLSICKYIFTRPFQ